LCCVAGIVSLAACGQQPRTAATSAPSPGSASPVPVGGWRTIAPPWGAADANSLANYAVSQDVPGLIVACYGVSTTPPGQGLSGTAHLWRTRDGGAQWQAVAATISLDDCGDLTMIAGSDGLLVTFSSLAGGPNGAGTIRVSPDAGDTWKTVTRFLPNELGANRFTAMQQAVYRDGRLYASLILNAYVGRLFSVSDDDGATWTTLDQVPTPAPGDEPVLTEQFAPDYRAPHAWFRYAEHGSLNASLPHHTTLDRSTDDGRTWKAISTLDAGAAALPQFGRPLVTSLHQPSRLCVGLEVLVYLPGERFPVTDLVLGASDDAGVTWHYVAISHIQEDGRSGDPEPLMDVRGNCYVSLAPQDISAADPSASTDSTILRLSPGGDAQPERVATLTRQFAGAAAVVPTSQPGRLNLWALSAPIPTGGKPVTYNAMHLMVTTVPG
jgi:hypothetical protein